MNPGFIPTWILGAPFIALILLSGAFCDFTHNGIVGADRYSHEQPLALLS